MFKCSILKKKLLDDLNMKCREENTHFVWI